ncbi:MAG TPA: DUF502 domain-containing protein [bacterium]
MRTVFLTGLLVTVPIIASILALKFLFKSIDGLVGSLPEKLFGQHIPGIGVVVTVLAVLLMGLLASNYLGKKIIAVGEKFLTRIPLVNIVYSAAKEFMLAVTLPNHMSFKEVVMVDYPYKGRFAYGFVTSRIERRTAQGSERLVNVFIPTTPVVTTGFTIAFPESEVMPINISVEKAIKLVMSGGIVAPKVIKEISGPGS